MNTQESDLLYRALCYERGHARRTQHILKVYALARLLGEKQGCSREEQEILHAAAILHDIAIRCCKEKYGGDASMPRQKQEAPALVRQFMEQARYPAALIPPVVELVLHHHDYDGPRSPLLQLLMEADLIVNCYESAPTEEALDRIGGLFCTQEGKELFALYRQGR